MDETIEQMNSFRYSGNTDIRNVFKEFVCFIGRYNVLCINIYIYVIGDISKHG